MRVQEPRGEQLKAHAENTERDDNEVESEKHFGSRARCKVSPGMSHPKSGRLIPACRRSRSLGMVGPELARGLTFRSTIEGREQARALPERVIISAHLWISD